MSPDVDEILRRLEEAGLVLESGAVQLVREMWARFGAGRLDELVQELADSGRVSPAEATRVGAAVQEAISAMEADPERLTPLLERAVQRGVGGGLDSLAAQGMDGLFIPPDRQRQFLDHSTQRFRGYWEAELQRMAGDVQRTLIDGVNRGAGSEEVARDLERRVGVSRARALLIATNELGNAAAHAQEMSQKELGVTHYIWRTAGDRRVRDSHRARQGQIFAFDDPPSGGNPGEAIRCRCVALGLPPDEPLPKPPQQPRPEAQFEQIAVGDQVRGVTSALTRPATATVLRGVTRAGLGSYLRDPAHQLGQVTLERRAASRYDPATRSVTLGIPPPSAIRQPWRAGKVQSVAASGQSRTEAMQRELVSLTGRHLLEVGGAPLDALVRRAAADAAARPVTQRARGSPGDYFAETWAAFHYHRDSLKRADPVGFRMVEDAQRLLSLRS